MAIDNMDQMQIDLGLDRMLQVMERFGNPHRQFKSVHIAGTNGKGSTGAFLANMLKEGGYRTGLYTSPHLETFNERIRISGTLIDDQSVESISNEIKSFSRDLPAGELTYFEFTTALAFVYFARKKVDIAVIETGLGGRLDATNIILPLVSVITPVALDHTDYLGNELGVVAAEKGGIIKKGVPLVIGRQESGVAKVLRNIALQNDSRVFVVGPDFDYMILENGTFDFRGIKGNIKGLQVLLFGKHQVENATLALAVLEILSDSGYNINEGALKKGIKETFWPGRFEVLSENPHVILDGAHNPAGAARLAEAINDKFPGERGVLIAGFMDDKDYYGMLASLIPFSTNIILTRPDQQRAFNPQAASDKIKEMAGGRDVRIVPVMKDAIKQGFILAKDKRFIIITGSLYGVGEARTLLKKEFLLL